MKVATKQAKQYKLATISMGVLLLALLTLVITQPARAAGFEEVNPPQNTTVEDKVEVLEYLWLGCPHCYALEPTMEKWLETKPDHVEFVREAPPLNPSWEPHSRGFYAAKLLDKEDEFVLAMFEAIHEKKQPMRDKNKIAELAGTIGLDVKKFRSTMDSFAVTGQMKQAYAKAVETGINSVPSIIINGKYRSSSSISGGNQGIIDTINERVAFEKEAMKLP